MHLVTITTNHDDHDNFHHDQSIIMIRFLNCEECLRGAKEATCGWCLDPDPNKLARSEIIMIMVTKGIMTMMMMMTDPDRNKIRM